MSREGKKCRKTQYLLKSVLGLTVGGMILCDKVEERFRNIPMTPVDRKCSTGVTV